MCHSSCLDFGRQNILYSDVHGKFVLEVGSMDVNGSLRPIVMQLNPAKYVGVDLDLGPGVDEICASENLIERFGRNSVDLLITTEMLEHVRDWRSVVHNLKHVVKPGGVLLVTTRSRGYPLHGYPSDYWRFEISDFQEIFRDLDIEALVSDSTGGPGVFMRARKPLEYFETSVDDYALYSVVARRRIAEIRFAKSEVLFFKIRLWLNTQIFRMIHFAIRFALYSLYFASRLVPRKIRQALKRRLWSRG